MKGLTVYLTADQNFILDADKGHKIKRMGHKKLSNHVKVIQKLVEADVPTDRPFDSSGLSINKENLINMITDADESLNFVLFVTNDLEKSELNHNLGNGDCVLYDIESGEMRKLVESFAGNMDSYYYQGNDRSRGKSPGPAGKDVSTKNMELTETEIEILRLICDEKTSEEIADEVCLGRRTIEHYRRRILIKTNCQSPIGLVKFAIKNKLYGDFT